MIHFVTPASADWTVREYLSRWGLPVADRIRIEHYETLLGRGRIESGTYVLSALCMLSPEERTVLANLCERLAAERSFRFLNHPTRSLRRLGLLEELARLGWNDFRAVQATGDFASLRYPVFLRAERTHTGRCLLCSARGARSKRRSGARSSGAGGWTTCSSSSSATPRTRAATTASTAPSWWATESSPAPWNAGARG